MKKLSFVVLLMFLVSLNGLTGIASGFSFRHAVHSVTHTVTHVTHQVTHGMTEAEKKAKDAAEAAKKKAEEEAKNAARLAEEAKKKAEEAAKKAAEEARKKAEEARQAAEEARKKAEELAKKLKEEALKEEAALARDVKGLSNLPKTTLDLVHSVYHTMDTFGKTTLKDALNKYWKELEKLAMYPFQFGEQMLICLVAEFELPFWLAEMAQAQKTVPAKLETPDSKLKYNEVCFLCSHNSYSCFSDCFFPYGQQIFSSSQQLAYGVRAFMLDTYKQDGQIVLSHGELKYQKFLRAIAYAGGIKKILKYSDVMKDFKVFLDRNPKEVLTIILEDYVKNAADFEKVYRETGLDKYIFTSKDYNNYKGWPTLAEMIRTNKRLVIFVDASGSVCDFQFKQWNYMVENKYSTLVNKEASTERSDSSNAGKGDYNVRQLMLLNFFDDDPSEVKDVFSELIKVDFKDLPGYPKHLKKALDYIHKGISDVAAESHSKTNDSGLKSFLDYEKSNGLDKRYKQRYPNFIAIDFISKGKGVEIVNEINRKSAAGPAKLFFPLIYDPKKLAEPADKTPANAQPKVFLKNMHLHDKKFIR